eukprot:162344-Rhodomonas_salina.1
MVHGSSYCLSKPTCLCDNFGIPATPSMECAFDLGMMNSNLDKAHRPPRNHQKQAANVPTTQKEFLQFTRGDLQCSPAQQRELDLAEQQAEKNRKEKATLLRMVIAAEERGNVILTRNPADDARQVQELMGLVQKARSSGHVRLFKRKTTGSVELPGRQHQAASAGQASLPSSEGSDAFTLRRGRRGRKRGNEEAMEEREDEKPVSYTHLTLPTICSV